MVTIREILIDLGYKDITETKDFTQKKCFADKHLSWGATIDYYNEFIQYEGNIYGIELIVPTSFITPNNYISIDHHNQYSNNPTAIEQVCEILSIPLNRYYQLVALNDRGYIPAMKAFGATDHEINNIRVLDRKAQGVTILDEQLAEESIKKNTVIINTVICVEALTPKFSPIVDRMFPYDKLLITYHNKLNYYGIGTLLLAEKYKTLILQNKAYYGGGEKGFFGFTPGAFEKEKIQCLKTEIINTVKEL